MKPSEYESVTANIDPYGQVNSVPAKAAKKRHNPLPDAERKRLHDQRVLELGAYVLLQLMDREHHVAESTQKAVDELNRLRRVYRNDTIPLEISQNCRAAIVCARGHCIRTNISTVNDPCPVCEVSEVLATTGKQFALVYNDYKGKSTEFVFACEDGHKFEANAAAAAEGCPGCNVLKAIPNNTAGKYLYVTLDTEMVIPLNRDYRLRFHCNRLRHDPACENPQCWMKERPGQYSAYYNPNDACKLSATCNQDFYASINQVLSKDALMPCEAHHAWSRGHEVIRTIKLFESHFCRRFDDYIPGLLPTGYNAALKIMYISPYDPLGESQLKQAKDFAAGHDVILFHMNKSDHKQDQIAARLTRMILAERLVVGHALSGRLEERMKKGLADSLKQHRIFGNKAKVVAPPFGGITEPMSLVPITCCVISQTYEGRRRRKPTPRSSPESDIAEPISVVVSAPEEPIEPITIDGLDPMAANVAE